MPYRQQQFVNDELYHITLRGLDDNLLFKDIDDYYRGVFSIYEFNTVQSIKIRERRRARLRFKQSLISSNSKNVFEPDKRDKLVTVLAWCLMSNHLHLLIKQLKDGGVGSFMRKTGTGYASYFNKKYNRRGYVFQNRFTAVHIGSDEQLKTVFIYIHVNPISLIEPGWKEAGIQSPKKVIEFLENYKWSSYQDYLGKKNFPSVTERDFMLTLLGGPEGCRQNIINWVGYKHEVTQLSQARPV